MSGRSVEGVSQHRHVTSGRPWADLTHTQAKTEEWCVGGRFQGAKQSRRARSQEEAVRKAGDKRRRLEASKPQMTVIRWCHG